MEQKFYTFPIQLTDIFFSWLYAQPEADTLKYAGEGFQKFKSFKAKKKVNEIEYGGRFGTQFLSKDQKDSFKAKFEKLLLDKHIDLKHMAPLLYLINFQEPFSEQESILTNRDNDLHDNAKFILDVIGNSWPVYQKLKDDIEYTQMYDKYTKEYFFAKNTLIVDLEHEDLLTYVSGTNEKDVIHFQRVNIYNKILYIPNDLIFTIRSTSKRSLVPFRKIEGKQSFDKSKNQTEIALPKHFNFHLFKFTLTSMLKDHQLNKTEFYYELSNETFDFSKMDEIYGQYKKNKFDKYQVLKKVILLLLKYLDSEGIFKIKTHQASFLFDYFLLFNAFDIPFTTSNTVRRKGKFRTRKTNEMTRTKFLTVVRDIRKADIMKTQRENKQLGEI